VLNFYNALSPDYEHFNGAGMKSFRIEYFHLKRLFLKFTHSLKFVKQTITFLKNGVFWDVTPRGSCKNRCFGGSSRLLNQGISLQRASVAS
jgi:hypothetical protein